MSTLTRQILDFFFIFIGTFQKEELPLLKDEILAFLNASPRAREPDLRNHLRFMFRRDISSIALYRLLKAMGWSWRVPNRFQTNKYTYVNLLYYCSYLQTIQNIPLEKLKFVDEAHVVSRELGTSKVLGLVGKRTYTRERTLNAPSASLTLLTSLVDEIPFFIDYRIQSNTQWDFADFLLLACEAGYLKKGDYLIMDNAAVHCGMESFEVVRSILDTFGVTVIKLPTYSPELNPVELVISQTKRHIRIERCRNEPQNLCVEVLESLSAITRQHIYNYYMKCVCPKVVLPDFFGP